MVIYWEVTWFLNMNFVTWLLTWQQHQQEDRVGHLTKNDSTAVHAFLVKNFTFQGKYRLLYCMLAYWRLFLFITDGEVVVSDALWKVEGLSVCSIRQRHATSRKYWIHSSDPQSTHCSLLLSTIHSSDLQSTHCSLLLFTIHSSDLQSTHCSLLLFTIHSSDPQSTHCSLLLFTSPQLKSSINSLFTSTVHNPRSSINSLSNSQSTHCSLLLFTIQLSFQDCSQSQLRSTINSLFTSTVHNPTNLQSTHFSLLLFKSTAQISNQLTVHFYCSQSTSIN